MMDLRTISKHQQYHVDIYLTFQLRDTNEANTTAALDVPAPNSAMPFSGLALTTQFI